MEPEQGSFVVDPNQVELLDAFKSTYERLGHVASRAKDAAIYSFALAELLITRGIIGMDELERARRRIDERMGQDPAEAALAVNVSDIDTDKYKVAPVNDIDCDTRIPLCQGACCRLRFALTEQDINERAVQWSPAEPYLNRQGGDGFCVHSDPEHRHCTVYDVRPLICRTYDCRTDPRIWVDFDNRVINPELGALIAKLHEAGVPVATPQLRKPKQEAVAAS